MKFSFLKCVAYLSLVPILKSSRRRLVKLFETAIHLRQENFISNEIVNYTFFSW